MTREPVIISKDADIMEAARLIDTYKVNRLPVVENGKVVGIVTRNDVIKAVARLEDKLCSPSRKPKPKPKK